MKWFKRRPKTETTTSGIEGLGDVSITVDRTGKVPRITVDLPEQAALGLMFEAKQNDLGPAHPETLAVAHRYGVVLGEQPGERERAIELLKWLAAARRDDPENRMLTLNDLSRLLQDARRLEEAEEVLRDALAGWERLRGQDDPNTLSAANNLAIVLVDLGRPDEADGLLRDTVARRARRLGPAHPDTITSRNALAGTLRGSPARLAEAERMYREILTDIGDDRSAQALTVRHNLAAVRFHRGDLDAAESTFRQVLAGRAGTLGTDHPDVLVTRSSLATVLNARGRVAEAEDQTAEVLAARQRVLGRHHPDSLDSMVDLAAIRANQGRIGEALPLLTEAIEGFRTTHGKDHPMVRELTAVLADLRRQHRG
jgi:tetratricopeptide (TPR) repeat protein